MSIGNLLHSFDANNDAKKGIEIHNENPTRHFNAQEVSQNGTEHDLIGF